MEDSFSFLLGLLVYTYTTSEQTLNQGRKGRTLYRLTHRLPSIDIDTSNNCVRRTRVATTQLGSTKYTQPYYYGSYLSVLSVYHKSFPTFFCFCCFEKGGGGVAHIRCVSSRLVLWWYS